MYVFTTGVANSFLRHINHHIVDAMGCSDLCSNSGKKHGDLMRFFTIAILGIVLGFSIGVNLPMRQPVKLTHLAEFVPDQNVTDKGGSATELKPNDTQKIWVPTNPRGAEPLPPGIVVPESDFYLRRLWGNPSEDLKSKPNYLVAFTVGYHQKNNIDLALKKFSENFTVVLFHYDGQVNEWDEFEWSKKAIHVSVPKQTKWWYAKRFLHPDIVAAYDYIFLWDEDLGVENFIAEEYIKLVKKYGLEISQPGLEPKPNTEVSWQMTIRNSSQEVHKQIVEKRPGRCPDPTKPPCAGFVEIMAPVFSRNAWRCVWYMIQNDLVHGWGLDLELGTCAQPAHEKVGVVDAQWIVHLHVPSLGDQGEKRDDQPAWKGVRERCGNEWNIFNQRLANAKREYFKSMNSKAH